MKKNSRLVPEDNTINENAMLSLLAVLKMLPLSQPKTVAESCGVGSAVVGFKKVGLVN